MSKRTAPLLVALAALVLAGAVSAVIILHGLAYNKGSSDVNNITRVFATLPIVLTWLSYEAVKREAFRWVVWGSAGLLMALAIVGAMSIGLFYLPSALMLVFAAVTMED